MEPIKDIEPISNYMLTVPLMDLFNCTLLISKVQETDYILL